MLKFVRRYAAYASSVSSPSKPSPEHAFWFRFLFVFLKADEGPFGADGVDFGAIRGAFWNHFGDFFRLRGIFKNACFTVVKRCFLRFRRVLDHDLFVLCF